MAQLVDDDEDVEEEDDFGEGDEGKEEGLEAVLHAEGDEEAEDRDDEDPEAEIGVALRLVRRAANVRWGTEP